jgi:hypothetical protein
MSKRQRCMNQNPRLPYHLPIELRHQIGEFCGLSHAIIHERFLDVFDQLDAMQTCVMNAYDEMDYYLGADECADIIDMRFPTVSKKLRLLKNARICKVGHVFGFQEDVCACDFDGQYVRAIHVCSVCEQDEADLCICGMARYCSNICRHIDWRRHRKSHRMHSTFDV